MGATYLDDILLFHRARANADRRDWRERMGDARDHAASLSDALRKGRNDLVCVIAEIKRRSPSKGWIDEHLDVVALARAYERGGATAVSVLTDEQFFSGTAGDLEAAHQAVSLPLLRKDFTVGPNDVLDAAQMGASAVLLIVAALGDDELILLQEVAHHCGLDALVEVHDREDVLRATSSGARLIGVNQRDLRTFVVDTKQAASLVSSLPREALLVAESGMTSVRDVELAGEVGFDAVLVGETFVRSADPEGTVRAFSSVRRAARG